jgi:hypothetical protein
MGGACSMYGGEDTTQHEMASCYITKELVQNKVLGWQLTAEHFNKPSPYKHTAVLIYFCKFTLYLPLLAQFPYCPLESHDPQTLVQLVCIHYQIHATQLHAFNSGKWPTLHTILFPYMFISVLYMFGATSCSSSGESIVSIQHLVYVTLGGRLVCRSGRH